MSTTSRKPEPQVASVTEIRSHFPALERVHNGYSVAYFDGPGGTQVPRYVVEKMADYLYHHNANTHWAYPTSAETDAARTRTRSLCRIPERVAHRDRLRRKHDDAHAPSFTLAEFGLQTRRRDHRDRTGP